ncbi:MAG TPA: ABC transporter substrate-binding protein [Acidimicrobiales bacterium]|nr:ABC transporter substrate-binding protein [Acidimicrobiales bacterium]
MSNVRRSLAAVALAALVAACSVSSSDSDTGSGAGARPGTAPRSRAAGAPVRGLTDDTIRLGVAPLDVERVREKFGVDLGRLPDEVLPALAAATNEAGGINGRRVELVINPIMPIGAEDSERACRELIEDEHVFAVLGTMIGDAPLCVTETHETPYIALWGLSAARQERSIAPFISLEGETGARLRSGIDHLVAEGTLDGAKVAVYHESDVPSDSIEAQIVEPLEAAGIDVVSTAQLPASGDAVQAASDIDRIFQRFQSDGADTVIAASGAAVFLPALARTSWSPQIVAMNGQFTGGPLDGLGLTDPAEMKGAIAAIAGTTSDDLVDDPLLAECFDKINAHSDLHLVPEDIYSESERPGSRNLGQVAGVCQLWQLAEQVLTAAGDDPSPQSIIDGLADLHDFPLTGYAHASLSPEQWGAVEGTRLWHFDVAADRFVPDGPIVPGERE